METKTKKPSLKKWWVLVLTLVIILGGIGTVFSGCGGDSTADTTPSVTDEGATPDDTPAEEPSATTGEKNALASAGTYLNTMAFSYTGLIKQLEFEGYTNAEATYAADNCDADWNEQAALKAEEYISTMSFSRQGLIDQLKYEGFTDSQAEHGADAVGY
jgi:hypothetical protein